MCQILNWAYLILQDVIKIIQSSFLSVFVTSTSSILLISQEKGELWKAKSTDLVSKQMLEYT